MIYPKRLSSGKYVDLGQFKVEDVDIFDIDRSLNNTIRFSGHYKDHKPLTVAQHTHLVVMFSKMYFPNEPLVHFDCVLHDFPEAYYGEIITPVKKVLGNGFTNWAGHIDYCVYEALWPEGKRVSKAEYIEIKRKTKLCDLMSLDTERRFMWRDQRGKDNWPDVPKHLSLDEKYSMFLRANKFPEYDLKVAYKNLVQAL